MSESERSLAAVAHEFRRAFEVADLSDAPGFLPHFPCGCCSWASWMLGHYLKFELGLPAFSIEGEREGADSSEPHAWLEVAGFTIDITADQFADSPSAVIVSANSQWHQLWSVSRRAEIEPIDRHDQPGWPVKPSEVYERVATIARD